MLKRPENLSSQQFSPATAAGAHLSESTALRSDEGLDVLYSTPARFVSLAPCISGHLHALATRPGENAGWPGSTVIKERTDFLSIIATRGISCFPS